jgi:hypothetical protein
LFLLVVLLVLTWANLAHAARKTVCTITVNSPDEKDLFRRSLPQDEFDFVELVERGRPDWLASACRKGVRCDVLLISGHFDGGTQFYTDRLHLDESLQVDEMERVSCSDSCPGLFSQLKEVYLFGCNTLNAEPLRSASAEIERSLQRSGHSPADAAQLARLLNERHAESNRDRMRNIFKDVPVIYGFSSKAPLGPIAATTLQRYFNAGYAHEIGSGRPSAKLLSLFAPVSMTVASGASDADAHAAFRRDVCHFADDRLSQAQKLAFVHALLRREMAEVRLFLDHIERHVASLTDADRASEPVARALDDIVSDRQARDRFLAFARDADEPATRARMLTLAHSLGWLTEAERQTEFVRMFNEHLAGDAIGSAEVDLACSLNKDGGLSRAVDRLQMPKANAAKVSHAAVLACLGSADAHAQVLRGLTSVDDGDVQMAQVYLGHRPIADAEELRSVAKGIARMPSSDAQVRALDTLARQRLNDRASLEALTQLFMLAKSVNVQRAIAGILIRADVHAIAKPELVRALRQHRLKSAEGNDLIDVLIRRLQSQ